MNEDRWARGLTLQQLAGIEKDTREREERYPNATKQDHIYKDIKSEREHRDYKRRD